MGINKTSSVSFPRVCLCRRKLLKTDLPIPVLVSPSWPGRDKPPAHVAPIQATSSQLPQGRWQARAAKKYCDKLPLQNPSNLHTVDVPFFKALYFHSFLMDVLVSLHSAYWFSFFFPLLDQIHEVEMPGKPAQILHHFVFFSPPLSKYIFLWLPVMPGFYPFFTPPAHLTGSD